MTTSVPPVLSPTLAPKTDAPSRAPESNESGEAHTFSEVLSQQQTTAHKAAGPISDPEAGTSARDKAASPQDPDATLSLILDSAALPLMTPPGPATPANAPLRAAAHAGRSAPARDTPLQTAGPAPLLAPEPQPAAAPGPTPGHGTAASQPHAALPTTRTVIDHSAAGTAASLPAGTQPPGSTVPERVAFTSAQAAQNTGPASQGLSVPSLASTATPADTPAPQDAAPSVSGIPAWGPQLPAALSAQGPTIALAVATPLTSPQWAQEFGQQILSLSQSRIQGQVGLHTVQLQVNPSDLGPVHITLQISDAGTQAAFVSPHAQVRQALENALPNLAQQFAQAGLSLGQTNVSDRGQQGFGQPAPGSQENRASAFNVTTAPRAGLAPLTAQGPLRVARLESLVDTFV